MQNLRKMTLFINGARRNFVCDPDKDTLADVLRRIGLTGTKIGCNAGQCGACTVILDGKLVRSCIKKMKKLKEFSEVVTIEGIGSPFHLHPLQQAWITYGGVQCGFCTPGFIVSAKALLDENANPSREEVRDWFQKNHNLCRCTGYKPLVDAVMAAASVLRGEKTMEDITFKMPEDDKLYGSSMPKPTALEKVTGFADYGDDIAGKMPEGTLHLAVVQPNADHANILGIDYSEAEKMSGVVKIITAKDVKGTNIAIPQAPHPRQKCDGLIKPIICDEKLFRYGDVVAVVAAESRAEARAAAAKIKVELEELPYYDTAPKAMARDAVVLHKETDSNVYNTNRIEKGEDFREVEKRAAYVVEGSFSSSREPHLPLEPTVCQAYWDEEGRMTVQCKSQTIWANLKAMAAGIGLPPEKIRIIQNPTGGSFGYSMASGEPALAAVCAMALDRPVTLTMTYPEFMAFSGKRAPSYTNAKLACDAEGKLLGMQYDFVLEAGAYPEIAVKLVTKAQRFLGNPYRLPSITGLAHGVLTNHSYAIQYRAFGSPQAYTASEAIIDMMAEKIGMDPWEFRYKNIARPGDTNPVQQPFMEYPMERMLEMIHPDYLAAVERVKKFNAESDGKLKRGVGIVFGGYNSGATHDYAEADLELNPDGSVTNYNSLEMMGQGADIATATHTYELMKPLGLTLDQVKLYMNDTAHTPNTGPSSGSRGYLMVGHATKDAARQLLEAMRKDDGSYRTYEEMTAEGIPTRYRGVFSAKAFTYPISVDTGYCAGPPSVGVNYITTVCEVEVDTETGKTRVLSLKSVTDIGPIGNKLGVEGQAYGAASHCVGFALSEDYSDHKKHSTMLGAGMPQILDVPDNMEFDFNVTMREFGINGSVGCSECFQSVSHMAIINGINNAVGVRIYELPATAKKVKEAIEAKKKGIELKPAPYDFGHDFYELYDELKANPVSR